MCVCVPLSPGFTVCVCLSEREPMDGSHSFWPECDGQRWTALLMWPDPSPSFLQRGDPFSCVNPISINSLGKEEGGDIMSEEKVHLFWLFLWPIFGFVHVGDSKKHRGEKATECRCRPGCRASQTAARRNLTTNMPDCGRRAPDRLLSSLAMWPQWAGERFFHSTSFPCHTERKRAADVWETA